MREQAKRVEEGMVGIVEACGTAKAEAWGEVKKIEEEQQGTYDVDGLGRPAGADGVFWDSQQEVSRKDAPDVKLWTRRELF